MLASHSIGVLDQLAPRVLYPPCHDSTTEAVMANKLLFKSGRGQAVPAADAVNEAGGLAYAMPPKHALAQYAATGCLNQTFYASADEQLDTVLKLCQTIEPAFIAKTAVYARSKGYMKDLPALLCATLA